MSDRTYSRDEAQAILSRAIERADGQGDALTHEELLAIGRELGLSDAAVNAAAASVGDEVLVKREVDERVRRGKRGFVSHLIPFALVNAMLVVINLATGGPWWFVWSLFGWGIGLSFHAHAAFFPDRPKLEARVRARIAKEKEREAKRSRKRGGQDSEEERRAKSRVKAAMHDVVAETLGAVADAISESRGGRPRVARDGERMRVDDEERAASELEAELERAYEEEGSRSRRR